MAYKVGFRHYVRPWRARRRRDGVEYFLGDFETKAEAEEREREFDREWPGNRGHANRGKQWDKRVGKFV
jgi:hypothetical protein